MALLLFCAPKASAWVVRIDGGGSGSLNSDKATRVLADTSGDVVAGGVLMSPDGREDPTVVKLAAADGSEIWRHTFDSSPKSSLFPPSVAGLAIDSNDDLLVTGTLINDSTEWAERDDLFVAKLDGATGAELWSRVLSSPNHGSGRQVLLDGSDDVIVVGRVRECVVMKLDGTTGADIWSTEPPDCTTAAVTSSGDVIIGGQDWWAKSNPVFRVSRLDGTTGSQIWATPIEPPGIAIGQVLSLTVDASGDVVAAGYLSSAGHGCQLPEFEPFRCGLTGQLFSVAKFDGATGAEIWLHATEPFGGHNLAWDVSVDTSGDVYAFGALVAAPNSDQSFSVAKIDGTTGLEIWLREISGTDGAPLTVEVPSPDAARAGHVDDTGMVWAGGWIRNEVSTLDSIVVGFDAATSAEVWRSEMEGTAKSTKVLGDRHDYDRVLDIALDPSGNPIAAGVLDQKETGQDFLVMKLRREDGTTRSVAGKKLLVQDRGTPAQRRMVAVLKDDLIQTPRAGTLHDPTIAGATIQLRNPTTLEEATFALPPGADWKALGTPPGAKGYRYRDKSGSGPCRSLAITPGKKATVNCKATGGPIDFTLDELAQGSLVVSIRLGDAAPQCSLFGGLVITDEVGQFKSKAAPGDAGCP